MNHLRTSKVSRETKQLGSIAKNKVMIELHVDDFEKVKEFYTHLGFNLVWERIPEGFAGHIVMELEDNILCFWGGNSNIYKHNYFSKQPEDTFKGYGVEIVLQVSDVEEIYEKAQELDCILKELQESPWGLKDFRIQDPFGFFLRITVPHNILSDENAVD